MNENDIVYRLRKRAEIRRQIPTRKSVQENQPDRIADLLEEAANEIERLRDKELEIIEECANLFPLTFTDEQYPRRIDKTIRKHFGIIE
jgi:hypothetical protein